MVWMLKILMVWNVPQNVTATIKSTVQSVISDFPIDMIDKMSLESAVTDGNMHRVLKGLDLYQLLFIPPVMDNILYYLPLKDMWRLRGTCQRAQMCVEKFLEKECELQISFYRDHGINPVIPYVNDLRKLQHDCLS